MAPAPFSLLSHPTPTPAVDPKSLLLAAKALVFCGFPYQRSSLTTVVREAHLGADTHLTVYLSTTEPNVPTPYGADRALLAWITTLTYDTGFVTLISVGRLLRRLSPRPLRRPVPALRGAPPSPPQLLPFP